MRDLPARRGRRLSPGPLPGAGVHSDVVVGWRSTSRWLSGVASTVLDMKAAVDHTACAAARESMVAARRAEHEVLLQVADLAARGVAQTCGYPQVTQRVDS